MVELNKISIAGIITLLITLSSGVTWYIQDAGTKTSCKTGFQYVNEGMYEGYYVCKTASGDRYEMCYEVRDSANTQNYWCQKGKVVKVFDNKMETKKWDGVIYCYKAPEGCVEK
jgi:hypothetical protein